MSGNSQENWQVAKHYLGGVVNGILDMTVRNHRFIPTLCVCLSYKLYVKSNGIIPFEDPFQWLIDALSETGIWTSAISVALKFGIVTFALSHFDTIFYILSALPRDIKGISRFARVLQRIRWAERNNFTVAKYLDQNAEKTPEKICFYFEDRTMTFQEVREMSNRVGNYFAGKGFQKGDVVALFMENRPEYVCIWLGLNKIGATAALVNYNIRDKSLLHCIQIVEAKALIYGSELSSAIEDLRVDHPQFFAKFPVYCSGLGHDENQPSPGENVLDLDKLLESPETSAETPEQLKLMKLNDPLFYIYTSGTTGMPKAAVIKQYRYMMAANGVHFMNCVTENDIVYDALPLYHMTGGIVGAGQTLLFGSPLVIRRKFSASQFWKDCIKYNATVALYLGETCRYLLAQPPSPEDKLHKVRLMSGNGLRHEIWEEFVARFNIKEVGEVYGSTEGNCNLSNCDNKVGAIGFVPRFVYSVLPTGLIKVDPVTGEPLRNQKTGLCIRCRPGEPGEMMAKIVNQHPIRDFQGYKEGSSSTSTSKKIVNDVFTKGDSAFRSGDILVMDELCYFYFKDRTGDTFRWKGENVSTTEVESIISSSGSCAHKDVTVYGVKVPHTEGRCGMVALVDPEKVTDLVELARTISKKLPAYARPLFLRILDEVDMTGTFKLKKVRLQEEGYDVGKIKDPVYFLQGSKFVRLDELLMMKINQGAIRL